MVNSWEPCIESGGGTQLNVLVPVLALLPLPNKISGRPKMRHDVGAQSCAVTLKGALALFQYLLFSSGPLKMAAGSSKDAFAFHCGTAIAK